jgi:tetratricopeptide (TPR) repeat protein
MSKARQNSQRKTKKSKKSVETPTFQDNKSIENDVKNSELRWQRHYSAGRCAIKKDHLEEAVREFQSALKFAERLNDYRVANTFADLGFVSMKLDEFKLAREFIRRALSQRETIYGANDPSVAIEYNNLAMTYEWQKDFVSAKPLLEKAVEILNSQTNLAVLNYAEPFENLAAICQQLENFIRAEELLKQALSIREEAAGNLHPLVLKTIAALADVQESAGKAEKAEETRTEYNRRLNEYAANKSYGATAAMLRRLLDFREGTAEKAKAERSISEFLKLAADR